MPRLPQKTVEHLAKARESCLAAVAAYNHPTAHFKTGSYIVLMIIAWTSLLHAVAFKRRLKPWRVQSGSGRGTRYERVGTDYRHWDLAECLQSYYGTDDNAVRANLRFLIGLRDQIEHRNMPELDDELFGECQATLLNFEDVLVSEFGDEFSVNASLAWSLQFSRQIPHEQWRAMQRQRLSSTDSVVEYVRTFRSDLSVDVLNDQRFAYKVFMIPQLANHRSADSLAVEFVHFDPKDQASMDEYANAVVLLKERHVAVRNPASLLPTAVAERVSRAIPWKFSAYSHHVACWRYFGVRPAADAVDPAKCETQYCQWDPTFGTYVYTEAWVERLIDELQDAERFQEVTGLAATV